MNEGIKPWDAIVSKRFVGGYLDIAVGTVIQRFHITQVVKSRDSVRVFSDWSAQKDASDPDSRWEYRNAYLVMFSSCATPDPIGEGRFRIEVRELGILVFIPEGWVNPRQFNSAMVEGIELRCLERVG